MGKHSRRVEWKSLVLKPLSLGRKKQLLDCQRTATKLSKRLHELNFARGQPEGIHIKYEAWLLDLASWTGPQILKGIEVSEKYTAPRPKASKPNETRDFLNGSRSSAPKA